MFITYLWGRFWFRIFDFFHHWYGHGTRNLTHYFISFFESLDRTLALKITLRHYFEPLYKDYTIIGRILGVIFRSLRILIGLMIYGFFGLIFLGVYFFWLLLLPAIIFAFLRGAFNF